MKVPNQARPITRAVSTAKFIGTKGNMQSQHTCHTCLEHCRDMHGHGAWAGCTLACLAICTAEGVGGAGMKLIFDHA